MVRAYFIIILVILSSINIDGQASEQDSISIWKSIQETESIEFTKPDQALKQYQEIYDRAISLNYFEPAFKAKLYSASVYSNLAKYDTALIYYDQAENINAKLNSRLNSALIALNRANTFVFKEDFEEAIKNHFAGIKILEENKDSFRLSTAYSNLSTVYQVMDDFDNQILYIKKAMAMTAKENLLSRGHNHCNLVAPYLMLNNFASAYDHCKTCDSLAILAENESLSFFSTRAWGEYHLFKEEPQAASSYFKKAMGIAEENQFNYYAQELYISLADALLNIESFNEAQSYLQKALTYAEEAGLLELRKKATFMLAVLEQRRGNHKEAMNYMLSHDSLKDSLVNAENKKLIADANAKFLTEKKDKELAISEIALQKSKSRSQLLSLGILSLLALSIFVWFSFKQRQNRIEQELKAIKKEQEVRSLEAIIEGEEKERIRIAQELHDGVNGDLAAIKFKLSSLLKMNNEIITEAVNMIDDSCHKVRAISHNLVPPSLQNFSLIEAVQSYCENMDSIHKEKINFTFIGTQPNLSKNQEVNILRIIQELLTNAIKHAQANSLDIQISNSNNSLMIVVEDDGKGYVIDDNSKIGIGLKNIKSRVDYLNAILQIESDEKGTSNLIELDLSKQL